MTKATHCALALLAALPLACPALAQSQTIKLAEGWRADEVIIVTGTRNRYAAGDSALATRTPTPLEEVPQSIQVLNAKLIADQDLRTLADAAANVSGIVPARTTEAVTRETIIRGFDTATYFDGLPAYGLTAVTTPTSLVNVERIEVAKGPSATLFGGATGAPLSGLINIVSKDPAEGFAATAAVRAARFDARGAEADVNAPLIPGRLLFRVTGAYDDAGSPIAAVNSTAWSINPSLSWSVSDATRVNLRGQQTHLEQLEYSGLPARLAFNPALGVDRFGFTGSRDAPPTKIDNTLLTASLDHRFSATLSGNFAIRRYTSQFQEFSTTPFLFLPQTNPTTFAFASAALPTDVDQTFATASLLWVARQGDVQHRVLIGVDGDDTSYSARLGFQPLGSLDYRVQQSVPFVPPSLRDAQDDAIASIAVFAQDQVKIGARLDVTAGVRWTRLKVRSRYTSGGVPFVNTNREEERITPRLGATYRVAEGVSVFAGFAQGFKGLVAAFGVTDPKPEESEAFDAGVKFASPVPGLSGTASMYQVTRQNVATADPANPFASIQTGEQRSRGAEIDLIYEPTPALSALFSYSWNDTEVTRDNTLPIGARPARVPRQSGRIAMRYRFQDGGLQGLEIGGGATYVGARFLTLPNALQAEAYTSLDAQASYPIGPVTVSASLTNLADSDHFEPYAYLNQAVVIPAQPRTLSVTLRYTFGK